MRNLQEHAKNAELEDYQTLEGNPESANILEAGRLH
jgi:hypothetical protein